MSSKNMLDSDIIIETKKYLCTIELNDKWIGYDLEIHVPKENMTPRRSNDTDIYSIYGGKNEEIALEIYDDLVDTVKAIYEGRIYYQSTLEFAYLAILNPNGTYRTNYSQRRNFLGFKFSSGWTSDEFLKTEFEKLEMKLLS